MGLEAKPRWFGVTALALAGAVLVSEGCSAFREIPPADYAARPSRDNVKVTLRDGRTFEFDSARIEADSLKGYSRRDDTGIIEEYDTHVFALADIGALSARRIDWYRTGLVGGVSLAAVIAAGIAVHARSNPTGSSGDGCPERNCGPQP